MKYFVFTTLFLLLACESINKPKEIKKNKNIQLEITTEPNIKVKK
tara:strand:+ start:465 stop:599 length:135 start_codon:yes stop_codon:yes gene_type:complete